MDDETIILTALLATNLDEHFSTLVHRYQEALYRFALRLSNRPQEAEDIVQEAFLRSYVALSHYPAAHIHTLHLRPWLYKLTLNVFRNSRRRILSTCSLESAEASMVLDLPGDEMTQPEIWFDRLERRQELEQALERLADYHREILICIYCEHLSYQEAATLLDVPLGTVRSRLNRGLKALRSILYTEGRKNYEPS